VSDEALLALSPEPPDSSPELGSSLVGVLLSLDVATSSVIALVELSLVSSLVGAVEALEVELLLVVRLLALACA
jgi:hypothetical protein